MMRTAALLLAALAATQDPAFEAIGSAGSEGFMPDGRREVVRVDSREKLEGRVWVRGTMKAGVLTVTDFERLPKEWSVKHDAGKTFTAAITDVCAWCDHEPSRAPGERRQFLLVTVSVKNKTDKALEITLGRAFLSFDEKSEGKAVSPFVVLDEEGERQKAAKVAVPAGDERSFTLRGENLFDEGNHGKTLYSAIVLVASDERVPVRCSSVVKETS